VAAAVDVFAELGFEGASTRQIARRAGTNQGLITYHFRSKEELWRAAVDRIFGLLKEGFVAPLASVADRDPRERVREGIRAYVRFAAAHPELFRLMVNEGKVADARMRWLVDTHVKPRFALLKRALGEVGIPEALQPHAFYVMAGASSLIFAVAPECRRLTGLDPATSEAIETHADYVARLIVP
jgi:AcrR family transcriptional regulator